MPSRRQTRLMIRLLLYVAVIVVIFLKRDDLSLGTLRERITGPRAADTALVISGRDLAPALIDRLVARYAQEYPQVVATVTGGGTNQALEDLANGRADVAFLYRAPTAAEQELFRQAHGDTAVVVPVAVGALLWLAGAQSGVDSASVNDLRALLRGPRDPAQAPFYAPDPNEGSWPAALAALGLDPSLTTEGGDSVFLADAATVVQAVESNSRAMGLVSSLNTPLDLEQDGPAGVKPVRLKAGPEAAAAAPTYENLATGDYPLHHFLYVACRPDGGIQGGKFVTHLGSARGLRQVERAGVLPARQVLREIYLSRDPL